MCVRVCGCVGAEANKAAVAAKGGIDAVVSAMRQHEGVVEVAQPGCAALAIIAALGGCSAARRACVRVRGVWAVQLRACTSGLERACVRSGPRH